VKLAVCFLALSTVNVTTGKKPVKDEMFRHLFPTRL